MKSYFQSFTEFKSRGGSIKTTTITPAQLLPALVAHIQRMDKQFTLLVNGRLPKAIDELLNDAFEQSHLQQPFYTQHCEHRSYRFINISKNRIKIDFTIRYRMNRTQEKWMLTEIEQTLAAIIRPQMSNLEKILAVHDYIVRTYDYDLHTQGSPYAVYTFMKEKHGVCMAYALLFEKMMEQLEIPCYYVIGKADGEGNNGHAWNMVELEGHWYHIDVTWDDIGSKSSAREIRYRYFLLSDEIMQRDHQWNLDDYPPCTSERFTALHPLYDVCITGDMLYYPHPKTALLYGMAINQEILKVKKRLDIRVQFIAYQEDALYFSNYSFKGYLYRYHLETKELMELSAAEAVSITARVDGLEVTYKDQSTELIAKTEPVVAEAIEKGSEAPIVQEMPINCVEVPFIRFDDSWMATYQQSRDLIPVRFTSAEGIELMIDDLYKQLTVDIYFDKGLHVHMTSARKELILTAPARMIIPRSLLPNDVEQLMYRLPSGELVEANCTITQNMLYVNVHKSTMFVL